MIYSWSQSIAVSADKFDNMTFSYILLDGRAPRYWSGNWLSCREPFCYFTKRTDALMSPNELCCNICASFEDTTSTHHRYKRCNDMTTAFDTIYLIMLMHQTNTTTTWIQTPKNSLICLFFCLEIIGFHNSYSWDLDFTKQKSRLFNW